MNVHRNLNYCALVISSNCKYFQITVKLLQISQNIIYAHHSLKITTVLALTFLVHRHSCTEAGQLQCNSGPPNGEKEIQPHNRNLTQTPLKNVGIPSENLSISC